MEISEKKHSINKYILLFSLFGQSSYILLLSIGTLYICFYKQNCINV